MLSAVGREAGVSQQRGVNSRSRQLIYCICLGPTKVTRVDTVLSFKGASSLCDHTSQCGYIGTNVGLSLSLYRDIVKHHILNIYIYSIYIQYILNICFN